MSDVTQILSRIEAGDPKAAEKLLPLVYDELRKLAAAKLAHEKPGQTLEATALVHEAYLKLVGEKDNVTFVNRRHFFAAAAEAMKQIVVDNARRKLAQIHGGEWNRVKSPKDFEGSEADPIQSLAIHELLERLALKRVRAADVAKMRLYLQMSLKEIAEVLEMSADTAEADWAYARAWMQREWQKGE
jgi:RNA polymerase sigma factor (TIGR02999 family)